MAVVLHQAKTIREENLPRVLDEVESLTEEEAERLVDEKTVPRPK